MLKSAQHGATDDRVFVQKFRGTWSIQGLTVGEGPIIVGLANEDYSAAEIEEWLENNTGWSAKDMIGQERLKRQCRQVGTFSGRLANESLNDGKAITTKLGFTIGAVGAMCFWMYNTASGALTTGAELFVEGGYTCKRL